MTTATDQKVCVDPLPPSSAGRNISANHVSPGKTIDELLVNWVWLPGWVDSSTANTAGRLVRFTRHVHLTAAPQKAVLHLSADTRYKLYVNGVRVAVGPARGSPWIWYYDSVDVGPFLREGDNELVIVVLRYFAAARAAMPFARTVMPGLTVVGSIATGEGEAVTDVRSAGEGWLGQADDSIAFPMGLVDDVFLHINERTTTTTMTTTMTTTPPPVRPVPYGFKTTNGELPPWRLRPRGFPLPEETPVTVAEVRKCNSPVEATQWATCLAGQGPLRLASGLSHTLEVQAATHSTAFVRWTFRTAGADAAPTRVVLKVTYSEGYEHEPRDYPFFRSKGDRLDAEHGHLIGPYDEVTVEVPGGGRAATYEPFWFRTFRVVRLEVHVTGPGPAVLQSLEAAQTNYPQGVRAAWAMDGDVDSAAMWVVSVRTLRNCMFDAYVDCPFYEQLQYAGDSRSVGLFHYLLAGDDRLMRQAVDNFAASVQAEGLPQSRFPSQVPQLIAGFGLYWVLQVCDHHLFFGDTAFARGMLPRIDGVLGFFDRHVNARGLVAGLPPGVWQYVDWVASWGATATHPDKGVPTAGRAANCHTYFSLLYAYVLGHAAQLARDVGRPGHAVEYTARAAALVAAVRRHCFDGRYFADAPLDVLDRAVAADSPNYSQHCQVFAVLAGAVEGPGEAARLLTDAFADARLSRCSYVMTFYALRAFAQAGDNAYESVYWPVVWQPWRRMLACRLATWEEDDVRQRSDCHAWGSVPIYEYCVEVAGIHPAAPGARRLLFRPRLRLTAALRARVCLGRDNVATVVWTTDRATGAVRVQLTLERPVDVVSVLPGGQETAHGVVEDLSWTWRES